MTPEELLGHLDQYEDRLPFYFSTNGTHLGCGVGEKELHTWAFPPDWPHIKTVGQLKEWLIENSELDCITCHGTRPWKTISIVGKYDNGIIIRFK